MPNPNPVNTFPSTTTDLNRFLREFSVAMLNPQQPASPYGANLTWQTDIYGNLSATPQGFGAGAATLLTGDSHASGNGLINPITEAFPNIVCAKRGWKVNNTAVAGTAFPDEVYQNTMVLANGLGTVNMVHMGTNDATNINIAQGGAQTAINAFSAATLQANIAAWCSFVGANQKDIQYGSELATTGTWIVGALGTQGYGAPYFAKVNQGVNAGTATFSFTGSRLDMLMVGTTSANTSAFTLTIDGVAQVFPLTGTTIGNLQTAYGGQTNALTMFSNTFRGLSDGPHTCVYSITNSNLSPGIFAVIGSSPSDTNTRPLVLMPYASRYGTLNASYANHTDAYIATVQAAQKVAYDQLQADGYNLVTYNYTQPLTQIPSALAAQGFTIANSWWDPNDATQTQADWQHPNYIGHRHIANNLLVSLYNAAR